MIDRFIMSNQNNKILLLTWEISPMYAGGLGILTESVVKEMQKQGLDITVLVPQIPKSIKLPDNVISLEKQTKKYYKQKLNIPDFNFDLENFRKSNRPEKIGWPKIFSNPKEQKSSSYNLYPNNTPAVTRAFAFAVQDFLKKESGYRAIIGMDWETIPTFRLLKTNGFKTPFIFYINGTEYDRNLEKTKINNTIKVIWDMEKNNYTLADNVICVSNFTKNILVKHYNVKASNILTVFNDITFYPSNNYYKDIKQNKTVLFIGRIANQKGLFFLLDTAKRVLEIDNQVKFIIAGDGEILPEVVEAVASKGLEKNCIFTGWLDTDQKKKLYRSSDLFVMPSPSEPFGLTPLEAIRSDLPVISSEKCGFIGVVPSTPTFKYYDTNAFAQLILYYLGSKENRTELLLKQQADLEKHSWSKEVAKIVKLIDTL